MMIPDNFEINLESNQIIDESPSIAGSLWTVKEVSQYLRLTPETVRAMSRRGQLPGMKIGRMWRFDRAAIESLVHDVS